MNKRIAIQGILGSFHEEAAKKFFGNDITIVECSTFKEECERLENGEADFAVMAIENAIAGSILGNYGLIRNYKFNVIGEVYLRIKMNLMALPGTKIKDLKSVQSHPMAIRQCEEFLWTLKGTKLIDVNDTAEVAKEIQEKQLKDVGAIANEICAELYGLHILAEGIETNKKNYTRFLVLSKGESPIGKKNKASINFELGYKAGSLARALAVFDEYAINMTKIQSVPIVGSPGEYSFYVDVVWDDENAYNKAMTGLLKKVSHLSVLGEYKQGENELIK